MTRYFMKGGKGEQFRKEAEITAASCLVIPTSEARRLPDDF